MSKHMQPNLRASSVRTATKRFALQPRTAPSLEASFTPALFDQQHATPAHQAHDDQDDGWTNLPVMPHICDAEEKACFSLKRPTPRLPMRSGSSFHPNKCNLKLGVTTAAAFEPVNKPATTSLSVRASSLSPSYLRSMGLCPAAERERSNYPHLDCDPGLADISMSSSLSSSSSSYCCLTPIHLASSGDLATGPPPIKRTAGDCAGGSSFDPRPAATAAAPLMPFDF